MEMQILLMRTLQLQQRIFSTFIFRSTAIQQDNWASISTIHSLSRFKSLINEFPCFQSKRLSSSFLDNGNENGPSREFFDGYYFIGEIPRDRIAHKWSKASGPGGSNVNANPTKAEIRFNLIEADWIPELVRERIAQKYKGNLNSRGELHLTSMQTRTAAENLEDCFEKLAKILREVSLDLVMERRREYIPQEYLDKLERRKEFAERRRIAEKKKIGHRREGKREGLY